jgi:multidrug efflux pump
MRFRPILMTTMAVLPSGLRLMLENGAGLGASKQLGYAIVAGLAFSQFVRRRYRKGVKEH